MVVLSSCLLIWSLLRPPWYGMTDDSGTLTIKLILLFASAASVTLLAPLWIKVCSWWVACQHFCTENLVAWFSVLVLYKVLRTTKVASISAVRTQTVNDTGK